MCPLSLQLKLWRCSRLIAKRVVKYLITTVLFAVLITFGFTYVKDIRGYYYLRSEVGELESALDSVHSFSDSVNTPSTLAESLEVLPYVVGDLFITTLQTTESGTEQAESITLEELKVLTGPASVIEVSIVSDNVEELLAHLVEVKLVYEYIDVTANVVTIRVYMKEV